MRENIFNSINNLYSLLATFQALSLQLGPRKSGEDAEPYLELIDDALARLKELVNEKVEARVKYEIIEKLGL